MEYHDVRADDRQMAAMLEYSDGVRRVPVIVDRGRVIIGVDGKT